MAKTRYKWWGFVKAIIRAYPAHVRDLEDQKTQSVTAAYDAMPHGSAPGKPVEALALRMLPKDEQRELDAVQTAIDITKRRPDGEEILKLICLVFWKQTHTLQGAAMACNVSYSTAKRWHNKFIEATARGFGLIQEKERER